MLASSAQKRAFGKLTAELIPNYTGSPTSRFAALVSLDSVRAGRRVHGVFETLSVADRDEIAVGCRNARLLQRERTLQLHLNRAAGFHAHILAARKQNRGETQDSASSSADAGSLAAGRQGANCRSRSRGLGDRRGVFALLAIGLNGPFLIFIFHRRMFFTGYTLDRPGQGQCTSLPRSSP